MTPNLACFFVIPWSALRSDLRACAVDCTMTDAAARIGAPSSTAAPGTRPAVARRMTSPLRLLMLLGLFVASTGCIPTQHFRAIADGRAELPPHCKAIERCDSADPRAQARCEMTDLSVPEAGALVVCTEATWEG